MYKGFHGTMAEITKCWHRGTALVDEFLPLIPGLTEKLESGVEVLDLGCGAGVHDCILGTIYRKIK